MYAKLTETQVVRMNFATEQKEWLRKHCPEFIDKALLATKHPRPESSRLPCVGSHVWQILGAETETAECNRPEMTLQTIWNDLPDETICSELLQTTHDMRWSSRRTFN